TLRVFKSLGMTGNRSPFQQTAAKSDWRKYPPDETITGGRSAKKNCATDRLRGPLSYLGLNPSRDPLRDRHHPTIAHGRNPLPPGRNDHAPYRAVAGRYPSISGRVADVADRRRVSLARRKWWRHSGRTICFVRSRLGDGGDC